MWKQITFLQYFIQKVIHDTTLSSSPKWPSIKCWLPKTTCKMPPSQLTHRCIPRISNIHNVGTYRVHASAMVIRVFYGCIFCTTTTYHSSIHHTIPCRATMMKPKHIHTPSIYCAVIANHIRLPPSVYGTTERIFEGRFLWDVFAKKKIEGKKLLSQS